MKIETQAVHAGREPDPSTGAVIPPIHLSTTFERDADGAYPRGYVYIRANNPTRVSLENALCALEGGAAAVTFGSGSAATQAVFQALNPADHALVARDTYYGTARLIREILVPWGLQVTFVDATRPAEISAALRPNTRLLWIETPSNPFLKITDIRRAADLARGAGARLVCDNTFATPVLQRPLELGADLVLHATTKYLNGHSDALGGVVIARQQDEFIARIKRIQEYAGAVPSPFDCWMVLRGLRTLPVRMRAHSENAQKVAAFLALHPAVQAVHYPGLSTHPDHALAARQMASFGGMLSVQIKGGSACAVAVAARAQLFTRATSLGGTESLIEHRASIEGKGSQTPDDLLRLSIGIENAEDLIDDLKQALKS